MASVWIAKRPARRGTRFRVMYRLGGREAAPRYGGPFSTMREARIRRDWIAGELAAMRVPDLRLLVGTEPVPTLRDAAARWQASRVDVSEATKVQHHNRPQPGAADSGSEATRRDRAEGNR